MKTKIINLAKNISKLDNSEIDELASVLLIEYDISATMYRFGISNLLNVEYDVHLNKVDSNNKLRTLRIIKELFGLGLKEAKDIIDNAPIRISENISWSDACDIKDVLEDVDAEIKIMGV